MNLGCGVNCYSDFLVDKGYKVLAVDIEDLSIAKTPVIVYDGKNLPTCDYDICIMCTVLHHIPFKKQEKIFEMLSKCCKKLLIMEDDLHFSTPFVCARTNLQLFSHPFSFRKHKDWLKFFSNYCNILYEKTDGHQCVYLLEFKCNETSKQ